MKPNWGGVANSVSWVATHETDSTQKIYVNIFFFTLKKFCAIGKVNYTEVIK